MYIKVLIFFLQWEITDIKLLTVNEKRFSIYVCILSCGFTVAFTMITFVFFFFFI